MISRIRGKFIKCSDSEVIIEVGGIFYTINVPLSVLQALKSKKENDILELTTYYYLTLDQSRAIPVIIGFLEELEKDFFEKFISVSGIGPRAAIKAFSKPVALIARAIEENDEAFLRTLDGIGKQKAKQIIASLQGKVGRFALIKDEPHKNIPEKSEIVEEAKQVLRRLQYNTKEIEDMITKALSASPDVNTVEDFLNEIYRQRK